MSTRLDLSQQQQLRQKLNPRQVKFGRVLEMSVPEFEDEVKRMLDENPALEEVSQQDSPITNVDDEGHKFNETAEQLQRADYSDPDDIPSYRLNISNHSADDAYYEPIATDESDAGVAILISQLAEFDIDELTREIAIYIIGNIDANGYLTRNVSEMSYDFAVNVGIEVSDEDVSNALSIVRSLDPAGIAAYNLRDCLLLQLERMPENRNVKNAIAIIRDRFEQFSKKHIDRIMSACNLSEEELRDALHIITSLNPKPGSILEPVNSSDRLRHITPDFNIDVSSDNEISVSLAGRIPELTIECTFMLNDNELKATHRDEATRAFIRTRRDEANDFIELAKMRNNTLMSVMEAIIRLQPEYFKTFDTSRLKPMVLRDIRDLTGLDLSVISRATASKYAMTPYGMISLKSLFSESLHEDSDTSVHAVSETIRSIIDEENKHTPLSDAAICNELKRRGMDVARRTVTKYRERMGIPVARLRKN